VGAGRVPATANRNRYRASVLIDEHDTDGLERAAILIAGTDHRYLSTGGIANLSVLGNSSANSASLAQSSASRSQKALSSALIVNAANWRHS
jgi:hypothetical protein